MLPGRTNFRVRVYPPNQAHEAAFEMSNYTKSAERAAFLMLQRPRVKGKPRFSLYQTGHMGQHLKIMVAR